MKINCGKLNVFRELSNIGSGNACTSLATMLNELVDIGVPKHDRLNFEDITAGYNSPEELVAGTVLQLSGDLEGFVMVIMKTDSAFNLLSKISNKKIECDINDHKLVSKELNPIGEICNILCGTYLTSISDMTNSTITPSIPNFSVDKVMEIMNAPMALYGEESDSALCIETDFFTDSHDIEGKYYFIPNVDTCSKLLASLGVEA